LRATEESTLSLSNNGNIGKLVIIIKPELRNTSRPPQRQRYEARLEGCDSVLCVSETPFFDGARALIRQGYDREFRLVMRHDGSANEALSGKLGIAANLTVKEYDDGRCPPTFAPYRCFPAHRVPQKSASGHVSEGSTAQIENPVGDETGDQ
jgi:hypothetical protein